MLESLAAKASSCYSPVAAQWRTHNQAVAAQTQPYHPVALPLPLQHQHYPHQHKRPRHETQRGGYQGRHAGRGGGPIDRSVPGAAGNNIWCAIHGKYGAHTTASNRMGEADRARTAAAATPGTSTPPVGALPPQIPAGSAPRALSPAIPTGKHQRPQAGTPPPTPPASVVQLPRGDITVTSGASLHPLIATHVEAYLTYPLPARWRTYLPQVSSFSAVDKLLTTHTSTSSSASSTFAPQPLLPLGFVSLLGLQRAARASIINQLKDSSRTAKEALEEEVHAFNDAAGYVRVYTSSMVGTIDEHVYSKKIATPNTASAIDISELWQLHQRSCDPCRPLGDFEQAVAGDANITNPCYISHIMAWVCGQWRLPLTQQPKRTDTPNYESFRACAHSLANSLEKMRPFLLQALILDPRRSSCPCSPSSAPTISSAHTTFCSS